MNENRRIATLATALLLALGGAAAWWLWPRTTPEAPPLPADPVAEGAVDTALNAREPAAPSYPVPPPAPEAAPLPALAESDAPFAAALGSLIDPTRLSSLLVPEQLVRRLVVLVDNLPRERLGNPPLALQRVPGSFLVKNRDGLMTASPANEARYVPALQLVQAAGPENLARLYLAWYPLFNAAYRELGLPGREFNDRLVQVLDHLLATPELQGPVALVQPKVVYQFADPALEARSAGQKMLLRMGAVNRAQALQALRAFRAVVAAGAPAAQ